MIVVAIIVVAVMALILSIVIERVIADKKNNAFYAKVEKINDRYHPPPRRNGPGIYRYSPRVQNPREFISAEGCIDLLYGSWDLSPQDVWDRGGDLFHFQFTKDGLFKQWHGRNLVYSGSFVIEEGNVIHYCDRTKRIKIHGFSISNAKCLLMTCYLDNHINFEKTKGGPTSGTIRYKNLKDAIEKSGCRLLVVG